MGQASNATKSRARMQEGRCVPTSIAPLDLVVFISPHSLALLHLRTCSFLSLFYFFLSIAPTFCCFRFSLAHFTPKFPSCSCLLPKHAQRPAPAFSTFQLAAPPYYAADTHRERLLLGHRPKTLLNYPSVSSLTSHTHSLPTFTNIVAGYIQHIQLERDSYPGFEPLKA